MQPLTIGAGQVLTADDLQQYATLTQAWQQYTPEWLASSGTTTLGNGTLVGYHKAIGSTMFFGIRFQWGSTTTQSSSGANWAFSLPEPPDVSVVGTAFWVVNAWILDTSTATRYVAHGYIDSVGPNTLVVSGGSGVVDDTTPMAWAAGDRLNIMGFYQMAAA